MQCLFQQRIVLFLAAPLTNAVLRDDEIGEGNGVRGDEGQRLAQRVDGLLVVCERHVCTTHVVPRLARNFQESALQLFYTVNVYRKCSSTVVLYSESVQ